VAAPSVEREQGLDHRSSALFVFALPFVLSAALDAGLSLLCDWLPQRRLRAIGLAATSLALLLVAGAPSAFWLSCGLALAGAASGLACSAARAELLTRHPGAGDLALARRSLFGGIGDLASPLLVAAVLALGGSFRGALRVVAALLAVQALVAWREAARAGSGSDPEEGAEPLWSSLRAAAGQRRLWLWVLGAGLCTLLDEIVLAFAALRLRLELGGTDTAAASCGVAISLGATFGAWLTEQLLRRMRPRRVLLLAAAACLLALGLVVGAPSAAWLLVLFQKPEPAGIFTIAMCSMWPTVLNTALGVRAVPQDYLNVARVLKLSRTKTLFKILLPAALPYMFTGFRLSLGIAWLVIVAAEMLTGAPGVGGFLWQEYNALIYEHIILCILTIGSVGFRARPPDGAARKAPARRLKRERSGKHVDPRSARCLQGLWRDPGAVRRIAPDFARRGGGHRGLLRRRQVHADRAARRPRAARHRSGHLPWPGAARTRPRAWRGVPELLAPALVDRVREREPGRGASVR
jgi:ABC-type proline/glycine betaine transport system permease subunit